MRTGTGAEKWRQMQTTCHTHAGTRNIVELVARTFWTQWKTVNVNGHLIQLHTMRHTKCKLRMHNGVWLPTTAATAEHWHCYNHCNAVLDCNGCQRDTHAPPNLDHSTFGGRNFSHLRENIKIFFSWRAPLWGWENCWRGQCHTKWNSMFSFLVTFCCCCSPLSQLFIVWTT